MANQTQELITMIKGINEIGMEVAALRAENKQLREERDYLRGLMDRLTPGKTEGQK